MSTATLARLNVILTAESAEFERAMMSASEKMQELGGKMQDVGASMSARLTAPIAAVGAALLAATVKVGNMADALLDLEQQTGLNTTSLQEFRHVATIAGVGADTVAQAAMKLQQRLNGVGDESEKVATALDILGVQVRNSDDSFRSMDDMLPEIIASLQGMEDVTHRNTIASELFGRGAIALAPVLGMTAEEFENARLEAHALGLVMERDALDAANEFRQGFDTLKTQMGAVVAEIGLAVIPVMNKMVQVMQRYVIPAARRVAQFIEGLSPGMQMVIAGAAAIVAAIGPVLVIFGTLIKVAGAVMAALAVFNPVTIAVVAAIATVVVAGVALQQNWERITDAIGNILNTIRSRFDSAVSNIVGFLNNLKTNSIDIVTSMMEAILGVITNIFGRVRDAVSNAVDSVLGLFRNMRREAVGNSIIPDMMDGILAEFREMETWMPESTEAATEATLGEFGGLFDDVMKRASGFVDDLKDKWGGVSDILRKPFDRFDSLKTNWSEFFASLGTSLTQFWSRIKGFWEKLTRFWEALARVGQGTGIPGPGDPFGPTFGGPGLGKMTPGEVQGMNMQSMLMAGQGSGAGAGISIESLNIDARGTADPDATGRSVARAFVEEIDRALGESSLREGRLLGVMSAL